METAFFIGLLVYPEKRVHLTSVAALALPR